MLHRPDTHGVAEFTYARAELGEGVLHPRRHRGVDRTADQALTLEVTQGAGEHLLSDAVQAAAQIVEADRSVAAAQHAQHQHDPLVGKDG